VTQAYRPASDLRLWAALAHASALLFGIGMVVPVIVWSSQRQKSTYAAFQALQALGYQVISFLVWLLLSLVLPLVALPVLTPYLKVDPTSIESIQSLQLGLVPNLLINGIMFGFLGLYALVALAAAGFTLVGREFHYPFMGKRLERYLEFQSDKPEIIGSMNDGHEDRWVAAMGHAIVIFPLWGMLLPLVTWLVGKRRSHWLHFQSVQALVYQAFVNVLFILISVIGVFSLIGLVALTIFIDQLSTSVLLIGMLFFLLLMLFVLLLLLIIPIFHIWGQVAAVRIVQGRDYLYPLLGRLLCKRMPEIAPVQVGK
jgi:uncharacterized Tic20 family protein